MYCVEESKDQVQLVLQFFFFASKRILQQFCWQEFSKTLRLLRRLDFHTGLDVGGLRVEWGVGPYSPSLVFLATARAQSWPRL